ncbi:hypothetical protein [Deinococcus sp.]|uniref:hypothetical protein n=1 Tax=Deinococcus sp. TaxID=47478 RepID=UPI003CC68D93
MPDRTAVSYSPARLREMVRRLDPDDAAVLMAVADDLEALNLRQGSLSMTALQPESAAPPVQPTRNAV